MIKRIVELSNPGRVRFKNSQITIEQGGNVVANIPVEDLGILLLAHPGNEITQNALSACEEAGVAVVVCNHKYLPTAIMLPLSGGSLHTATLQVQIQAKRSVRSNLTHIILVSKVKAQARCLTAFGKDASHLDQMAPRIRKHEALQREAQAAAYYWKTLQGKQFRRDPDESGLNSWLNYGYAIIRAATARAIVGSGLHPALGLFHRSRGNNFALADDLMEPLRPAVDFIAIQGWTRYGDTLNTSGKLAFLEMLSQRVVISTEHLPLWVALQRYVASAKFALSNETNALEIPQWPFSADLEQCG